MIDTTEIRAQYDLRSLVEQDLGQPPIRSGRAALYKCPFHGEQKGYSLAIWADGYRCFGKCDTAGDHFDWLMTYHGLTFAEALASLNSGAFQASPELKPVIRACSTEPPPQAWQTSAREVVEIAEDWLWSSQGERALTYLLRRGLSAETIHKARLGYIPGGYQQWREIAGLHVPCGISIPWFAADALWAVKVRRAYGEPKYAQIAGGSSHGLYHVDALKPGGTSVFCEGEFDALLVQQEAGSLVSAVTLGSATNRLTARWHAELASQRTIFVSYDQDDAGERGAQRLLSISPRFRELPVPSGKDISDFFHAGGDLYAWVSSAHKGTG